MSGFSTKRCATFGGESGGGRFAESLLRDGIFSLIWFGTLRVFVSYLEDSDDD
jgi:hypothetical protein